MSSRSVTFACIVSVLAIPLFASAQSPTSVTEVPEGALLPVVLKKTIKASKAKVGDEVRFELLSPLLAENSVVIPKSAKLFGRIVYAQPLAGKPYSALAIAVDRAEWHSSSVPLHGHLAGFGKFKYVLQSADGPSCSGAVPTPAAPPGPVRAVVRPDAPQRPVRGYGLGTTQPDDLPAELKSCGSSTTRSESDMRSLAHIRMRHTNSRLVPLALVSTKRDIVLKKGLLLVVRNGPPPATAGGAASPRTLSSRGH